jgi:hypothetical protein
VFRRRKADPSVDASEPEVDVADDGATAVDDSEGADDTDGRSTIAPVDRSSGPYDLTEEPEDGLTRLDLGGLRVPGVDGMELRLEVDEAAEQVVAITVAHAESAMQLTAFAAPRVDGIWDEVREEIRGSLAGSGLVEEVDGPLGRELHATLTLTGPAGQTVMQPVRFVGVDGPRWFLRALFSGAAAREADAAAPLEAVLRATVVVRGSDPMAPGDPLPLNVPTEVPEGISRNEADEDEVRARKGLAAPKRGPEITEIH